MAVMVVACCGLAAFGLYECSPGVQAQKFAAAGTGVAKGMEKLLAAHPAPGRKAIVVGALTGHKAGDNPHLWYDPANMKAAGAALAAALVAVDPAHAAD